MVPENERINNNPGISCLCGWFTIDLKKDRRKNTFIIISSTIELNEEL